MIDDVGRRERKRLVERQSPRVDPGQHRRSQQPLERRAHREPVIRSVRQGRTPTELEREDAESPAGGGLDRGEPGVGVDGLRGRANQPSRARTSPQAGGSGQETAPGRLHEAVFVQAVHWYSAAATGAAGGKAARFTGRQHAPQRGGDARRRTDVVVVDAVVADQAESARHQWADHRVAGDQRAPRRQRRGQAAGGAIRVGDVLEHREADDRVEVARRQVAVAQQVGAAEVAAAARRDQPIQIGRQGQVGAGVAGEVAGQRRHQHAAAHPHLQHVTPAVRQERRGPSAAGGGRASRPTGDSSRGGDRPGRSGSVSRAAATRSGSPSLQRFCATRIMKPPRLRRNGRSQAARSAQANRRASCGTRKTWDDGVTTRTPRTVIRSTPAGR